MANKIFSTYKSRKERGATINDRIVVEIGHTHIACMIVAAKSNNVEDFELFELSSSSFKNFEESFAYVVIASRLLDKPYADKKVYFNSPQSVLIPAHLYNVQNSAQYLSLIFGNNKDEVFRDDLNAYFQLINVYSIPAQVKEVVEKNLSVVSVEHTYSSIIKALFQELTSLPSPLIKVQFYKNHFIVAVFLQHRFQYIQSFTFAAPEDVLYHLVNICHHFNIKGALLQVSGMLDLKSTMYAVLSAHFKNIHTEELTIPDLDLSDYPLHYFTPFFKLVK